MFIFVLQMRMNVRLGIRVHMPATTQWAPTTAPVPEASPSQPKGGRVRVQTLSRALTQRGSKSPLSLFSPLS